MCYKATFSTFDIPIENQIRFIYLYRDYFPDFFKKQKQKVKDKIIWTFRIVETLHQIPSDYLKHIEGTSG